MKSIGIDIGASHIACGLYNDDIKKLENKIYVLNKMDTKLDINVSTKYFVDFIINLIDKLIKQYNININNVESIGLGCPGGIDRQNGIFLGSSEMNLNRINFRKALEKYNTKVFVENDCSCAGYSESYLSGLNEFLMITLGTNLGVAYIKDYKCIDEIVWNIIKINKSSFQGKYIKSFSNLSQIYNNMKRKDFPRGAIFNRYRKRGYRS